MMVQSELTLVQQRSGSLQAPPGMMGTQPKTPERMNEHMRRSRKFLAGGVLAVAVIGGGAGIAVASGAFDDDGDEVPIRGEALDRATTVVLEEYPGGRVTDTEVGDEEGHYEVEVTLENGDQVDVHLDEDFNFLGTENDGPDDSEDDGDEE